MVSLPSTALPKMNLPMISGMLHGQDVGNPEDAIFEDLAEQQLEKEKQDSNFFFDFLDYISRPQSAVAGVLKDLVDGGDFSPFDRVGQALAGKERFGIKEVIDEVAPGQWSNMKLPDFLGGKDIDPMKEGLGFLGDVLTDPLMSINIFGAVGKGGKMVRKFGPMEETVLRETAKRELVGKSGKIIGPRAKDSLSGSLIEDLTTGAIKRSEKAKGVYYHSAGAIHANRMKHRELYHVWEEAVSHPDEFISGLRSREARKYFKSAIKDDGVLGGTFKHLSSPAAAERFRAGEQGLITLRMPWLMRQLGIPDGQWSLIPKLDKQWGSALADGVGNMMGNFFMTKPGQAMLHTWKHIFKTGSGDPTLDMIAATTASAKRMDWQQTEDFMRDMRKQFKGRTDNDTVTKITEMIMHPHDEFGLDERNIYKELLKHAKGDEDEAKVLLGIVNDLKNSLKDRAATHAKVPGMTHKVIGGPATPKTAHEALIEKIKYENKDLAPGYISNLTTYDDIKKLAKKNAKTELEEMLKTSTKLKGGTLKREYKKLYSSQLGRLVRDDIHRAQNWISNTIPLRETGYFPRNLTDDAKDILQSMIQHPKVQYGEKAAADVFFNALKGRSLYHLDVHELNQLFRDGELPYDFMEKIMASARTNMKGKDRSIWMKWLGMLDADQLQMYIDDPLQATAMYFYSSGKAISEQQRLNQIVKLFSRFIHPDELKKGGRMPPLGEKMGMLSPDGFRAVFGQSVDKMLGDDAAKYYREIIAKHGVGHNAEMGNLFYNMNDLFDYGVAAKKGIPIFGMSQDVLQEMNRATKMMADPDSWRPLIKAYDEITNMWKGWTLAVFPSYHARNFVSGFSQAWFSGYNDIQDYKAAFSMFKNHKMLYEGHPSKRADVLKFIADDPGSDIIKKGTWNGKDYTEAMLYQDLQKFNVMQTGFYAEELLKQGDANWAELGLEHQSRIMAAAKGLTHKGKPMRTAFWVGNVADNWHRVAMFRNAIRKGKTPFEASQIVKKYLFDYGELGLGEKAVFRRIFPFYTWLRKNLPLQAEFALTKPGKFAQMQRTFELLQTNEAKEFDQKLLPKWVRQHGGLPMRVNKETDNLEVAMLGTWTPAHDLKNMGGLKPMFDTAMGLLNPIPKLVFEKMQNYSTFSGEPIERFPGEPYGIPFLGMDLQRTTVHGLKSMRLLNELDKASKGVSGLFTGDVASVPSGELPAGQVVWDILGLAPKAKAFNIESLRRTHQFEVAQRKGEIKKTAGRLKKVGGREKKQEFIRRIQKATRKTVQVD